MLLLLLGEKVSLIGTAEGSPANEFPFAASMVRLAPNNLRAIVSAHPLT